MSDATPTTNATDPGGGLPIDVGDVIADKYVVDGMLGRGGMGVVFSATHRISRQRVAIKVISVPRSVRSEALVRFRTEARAVAALSSPHVARVYDVDMLDPSTPFMVMELLHGESLASALRRGPLAIDLVTKIVREICDALGEAHALRIVHRDLKPDNVFLARRPNGKMTTKVLDFGISKVSAEGLEPEAALTTANRLLGTPTYMAPEQLLDAASVTDRADVWALGVILFAMLTGTLPFRATNLADVSEQILRAWFPSVATLRPDAPRVLVDAVDRCLRREPRERCTIEDLAEMLDAGTGGVSAPPPELVPGAAARATHTEAHRTELASGPPPALLAPPPPEPLARASAAPPTRKKAAIAASVLGVVALAGTFAVARAVHRSEPAEPGATPSPAPSPSAAPSRAASTNAVAPDAPSTNGHADAVPPATGSAARANPKAKDPRDTHRHAIAPRSLVVTTASAPAPVVPALER